MLRFTDLECSHRWFQQRLKTWETRRDMAKAEGKEGHVCYAEKQMEVWRKFENRAEVAIKSDRQPFEKCFL